MSTKAGGHESVGALGPFQDDVGALLLHEGKETTVEFPTLFLQHMTHHFDARLFQFSEAVACHQGIGVVVAADHPTDAFLDDKVGTGRRLAIVRARLQVYK